MPKKVPDDADRERVLKTLRAIVDAPAGTGSQAARYAAAMRLAKLTGLDVGPVPQVEPPPAEDPMSDLTEMEALRRRRARRW